MAEGESVVVIAGAGGVGSLAVQLAPALGRRPGDRHRLQPEKRALAEELGAHATVDPALAEDDPKQFTGALREANGGKPVDIVLEMTGGNVFDGSLSALAPVRPAGGLRPGRPARSPKPINAGPLIQKSRAVIGFWLAHLHGPPADAGRRDERTAADGGRGCAEARSSAAATRCPNVREAHQDLLARRSTGKLVLDPAR